MNVGVERVLERFAEERRERGEGAGMTLNAIVFTDDPNARLLAGVETLVSKHPARTIVLDDSAAPHEPVVTSTLPHGERVELGVNGMEPPALQQIVHHLLLHGVPSALIWAAANFEDGRAPALTGTAGSVIVDSSAAGDGLQLRSLLRLIGRCGERCLCDLAYLRIAPWQDAVAQCFDDPDICAELGSISSVAVDGASHPQAYYLIGWLASRLHWQPCGPHRFCNADGREIAIDVRPSDAPVNSVRIESARASISVTLEEQAAILCLTVEGELSRPRRCAPLHDFDDPSLLEQAILAPGSSDLFVETLQTLRTILDLEPA